MITDQAQPLQSYLETLVTGKWSNWATGVLSREVPDGLRNSGFQVLLNAESADARTRTLEFLRLGFLKGRLISERGAQANDLPDGWSMLLSGESPISHDGALASVLGEALVATSDDGFKSRLRIGIALLGLGAMLKWAMNIDGKIYSQLLIYQYVLDKCLEVAPHLDYATRIELQRNVSQAVNNTLDSTSHSSHLVADYLNNNPSPNLIVETQKPAATVRTDIAQLVSESIAVTGLLPPIETLKRHKASLYFGSESGLYGAVAGDHGGFLSDLVAIDRTEHLTNGRSLFEAVVLDDSGSSTSSFRKLDDTFLAFSKVSEHWRKAMQHVYEVALEALAEIRPTKASGPSSFYPEELTGELSTGVDLHVPIAKVPLLPRAGDLVVYGDSSFVVSAVSETPEGEIRVTLG